MPGIKYVCTLPSPLRPRSRLSPRTTIFSANCSCWVFYYSLTQKGRITPSSAGTTGRNSVAVVYKRSEYIIIEVCSFLKIYNSMLLFISLIVYYESSSVWPWVPSILIEVDGTDMEWTLRKHCRNWAKMKLDQEGENTFKCST